MKVVKTSPVNAVVELEKRPCRVRGYIDKGLYGMFVAMAKGAGRSKSSMLRVALKNEVERRRISKLKPASLRLRALKNWKPIE